MNDHTDPEASVPDDDAALSPEAMLALLDDQRRSVEGQMAAFVPMIMLVWGVAWLFGFGALWLIDGLAPAFSLPLPIAITVFVALLAVAIALSAVLGIRSGRGVRGDTRAAFQGAAYGTLWWVGSIAVLVFGQVLFVNGMDRSLANVYYPVAYVLFTGVMFIVAGIIWQAVPSLVLGAWTMLVSLVAGFFGYPTHYLVLAIGGGLGFLILAVSAFVYLGRLRRAANPEAARRG